MQERKRLFDSPSSVKNERKIHRHNNELTVISPLKWKSEEIVMNHEERTFNDPVHKTIKMEGLCLKIIDTYEFQRLHNLKQLGVCDYVFRGATHTRFVHSLGVAHLAERLIRTINKPELKISEIDIVCVKIAGSYKNFHTFEFKK